MSLARALSTKIFSDLDRYPSIRLLLLSKSTPKVVFLRPPLPTAKASFCSSYSLHSDWRPSPRATPFFPASNPNPPAAMLASRLAWCRGEATSWKSEKGSSSRRLDSAMSSSMLACRCLLLVLSKIRLFNSDISGTTDKSRPFIRALPNGEGGGRAPTGRLLMSPKGDTESFGNA